MNIITSVDLFATCQIAVVYPDDDQQVMFRLLFAGL